jgi:maleamate amidohydrolase
MEQRPPDVESARTGVRPGGFAGRLGWGSRPALLLIDMVRAYFSPDAPFYLGRPEVLDACTTLLSTARRQGIPVVHTTVRYGRDGADGGLFIRKVPALALFREGDPRDWHETVPEIAPADGEVVVVKQYASAFAGTSLAATLASLGVDTLVIGGVSTSGCVRASATDALQAGLRPMVVRQACADRSAEIHEANLYDLDLKYADVIDIDEAVTGMAEPVHRFDVDGRR